MACRIRFANTPPVLVEIARSFSYKLNTGSYQSEDFFCSQKKQCHEKDAEKVSEQLYQFCRSQVFQAVNERRKELGMKPHTLATQTANNPGRER